MLLCLRPLTPAAGILAAYHGQLRLPTLFSKDNRDSKLNACRSSLVYCTDATAILPAHTLAQDNDVQLVMEMPGPCRASRNRAAKDLPDADMQRPQKVQRRIRGKQKTVIQWDTPLNSIGASEMNPSATPDAVDDFHLPLTDIGGNEEEPLDAVEPTEEELQVTVQRRLIFLWQ